MIVRSICCAALVVCAFVWYESAQQYQSSVSQQQQTATTALGARPLPAWSSVKASKLTTAATAAAAAAYNSLLHGSAATARSLLGINQQPNATAAAAGGRRGVGDAGIISVSGDQPPNINPTVLNVSAPQRPAPAPAPTSAAAGEAATAVPWTGPSIKSVSEVKAGDSCVCWTPDWCTCGWQACPYKPPQQAAVLPNSAQAIFGSDMLPQLQLSADAPGPRMAPPLTQSMLRRFNKRISTQLINPLYQFTSAHYVLEGAKEVVAAGGDSYKFHLANLDARGRAITNVKTVLDMVRSPSLPYADVFDLPLSMYFMWVFPDYSKPYEETYALATYLLQRYQGTGKQFFVGMWEGDHALRKPGNWGHHIPPDVGRMEVLQYVVQEKQRAVDNAKRDYPACRNVYVWNYIEANFVLGSIWNRNKISIVNWLVPTIDEPPVDYISYSAYEVLFSGDWKLTNLTAAFDYMAQRMPDKPGVPGPRVFLGEWAYPMFDPQGRKAWDLEESREKGLYAAAVAIAWGSQFNQYWQLYSNHRFNNGTGDRGFWLVLPNRREAPIWTSMKDYFAASDIFLQRFWACYGGWPSDYTYRVWSVKTLMKLVNNATKPEPPVRELASTSYSAQARVVADNTFGQMGPTITFRVTGQTPAEAATHASSYIPIMGAVKLGDITGSSADGSSSSSSDARQFTPPLVPQFLPPGGGDRGRCPIALPMIAAGTPVPPRTSPAPAAAGGNRTAPPNGTQPGRSSNTTAPAAGAAANAATRPPGAGANTTAAGSAAVGANATRPPGQPNNPGSGRGGPPGPSPRPGGNSSAGFTGTMPPQAALMMGSSSASGSRAQEEAGKAVRTPGGKAEQCESWSKVSGRLQLDKEECPVQYPRLSLEDVASGKAKPYTYGGIDRLGCVNCHQKGLWPRFCLWRRTELPIWDSVSCNQRESKGRSSVQRNLDLAVNISRYWPESSGITLPSSVNRQRLPPGPAEITPCDVFRLIRGRTLWIVGDSQMKAMYTALKCFMLEFWDMQQYSPTWNATIIDYLDKLPRNAEAKCIHLPQSTRICQLKVLWADTFVEKPSAGETRWTVPVLDVLLQQLADPTDIIVMNFGLWYDPKNPTRYYNNLISLGQAYQAARATFPNMFFVETVKLHWPDPPGDQDGPRTVTEAGGAEQCMPTENVEFDARTSQLKRVMYTDSTAVTTAAGQLLLMGIPEYQSGPEYLNDAASSSSAGSSVAVSSSDGSSAAGSSSDSSVSTTGRHRRRLLGIPSSYGSSKQGHSAAGAGLGRRLLLSLLHSAQENMLQGRFMRALLQQQQRPAGNAAGPSMGGRVGGPLEDSPSFPVLQPASAAATQQPRQQQQGTPLQPQPPAGRSSTNVTAPPKSTAVASAAAAAPGSTAANASRPSSSGNSSSSNESETATGTQFPLLRPTYAPNSARQKANTMNSSSSSSANTSRIQSESGTRPSSNPLAASPVVPPGQSPRPGAAASSPPAAAAAGAAAPASKPILAPGFGSVTLPPELATDAVLTGLWRNQIARAVLRDRFGMAWVPIYNATVPAYWGHRDSPQAPDCIHYCNPGAPQNWVAKLMLAIAVNVQPLEGEIADKRCLWGSKVMYDEGEQGFQ